MSSAHAPRFTSTLTGALLEVRDVHLWRGEHHLLRGVSFSVAAGQLLQLTGPNGAGKTSLLRVIARLLPAESGELFWNGQRAAADYRQSMLYLGHSNALKLDLTALENLRFSAGLSREISAAQCQAALQAVAIPHCAELPVRVLSAGQRRRVALARLLLSSVPLWVLDEPITNLDVSGIALVESLLAQHLERGGMIIAAAHQPLLVGHAGVASVQLQ